MASVQEMMNQGCIQLELAELDKRKGRVEAALAKYRASLQCFERMLPFLADRDGRSEEVVQGKCRDIRDCIAELSGAAVPGPQAGL